MFYRLSLLLAVLTLPLLAGCQKAAKPVAKAAKFAPADDETPDTKLGAGEPAAGPEQPGDDASANSASANSASANSASVNSPPANSAPAKTPEDPRPSGPSPAAKAGAADPQGEEPKKGAAKEDPPTGGEEKALNEGDDAKALAAANPYPRRAKMPELPEKAEWINTRPLRMADLKGKFVLFDFWTYCCINCIHVLPELKKLEEKYPNELVVIGVHAAKFDTEKDPENIASAVVRYEIKHPVLVDSDHYFWNTIGVSSWPTVLLVDPEGKAIWGKPGEMKAEEVERIMEIGLEYYRKNKLLDETPLRFELEEYKYKQTPLRFPGKILADEASGRLFITDSNHNRIVITSLDGKLQEIIGSGAIGRKDGDFKTCSFDHPQGVALTGDTLYIADTENHLLRKVDLKKKTVSTISGTGEQAKSAWPGLDPNARTLDDLPERFVGPPKTTGLNSPWALLVHDKNLYIAMAGPHQIWKMTLDEKEIGPYAGNGREDIVDGVLMPAQPYGSEDAAGKPVSAFAQPSGLATDGKWLYVADTEGSSLRAVPFDPTKTVKTLVGSSLLPGGRLFAFGDRDGVGLLEPKDKDSFYRGDVKDTKGVLLQHAIGVAYADGKLYVADTYNNRIKVTDATTGETKTIAGDGKPGSGDDPAQFDEPAGLSVAKGTLYIADTNNHKIRTVDIASGKVGTLKIEGLKPPAAQSKPTKPDFARAAQVKAERAKVKSKDGKIAVTVKISLEPGWKINNLAPMRLWVEAKGEKGVVVSRSPSSQSIEPPKGEFTIHVPVKGEGADTLVVSLPFHYCQESGKGLCKVGRVVWTAPIEVAADGADSLTLSHEVKANALAP